MLTRAAFSLLVVRPESTETFALPSWGTIRIGRGPDNEIRIDERSVSRQHAVLHIDDRLRLEDLGGVNATHLRRATQAAGPGQTEPLQALRRETVSVAPGDRILLGTAQIVVRQSPGTPDTEAGAHVAQDAATIELFTQAGRVATSPISVLLLGETGVGKDVVARFIHARSPRASGPFIAANCAAFAESLLEAELFGSERGAYTGSTQARPGLFETAEKGTLFLDEVGDLPLSAQAKLLRAVEDRKVSRIGSQTPRSVDVRFIAATNQDLERASALGKFRSDLYFRLAGMTLRIPPLRERRADIAPLANAFLQQACRAFDRPALDFSEQAVAAIERHSWPGNVRELKNAVERGVATCVGTRIELEHLPRQLVAAETEPPGERQSVAPRDPAGGAGPVEHLKQSLHEAERAQLLQALEQCAGNQTRAAELLGISRRTLINRLRSYGVPRPRKG